MIHSLAHAKTLYQQNLYLRLCSCFQNNAREAAFKQHISRTEDRLSELQLLLQNQSHLIDDVTRDLQSLQTISKHQQGAPPYCMEAHWRDSQ